MSPDLRAADVAQGTAAIFALIRCPSCGCLVCKVAAETRAVLDIRCRRCKHHWQAVVKRSEVIVRLK